MIIGTGGQGASWIMLTKNKKVEIVISVGQSASLIVFDGWAAFVFVFVFGGLLHQAA